MRNMVVVSALALLMSTGAVAGTKMENGVEVRDWSAVDVNKDHSVSPQEMQQFLQEQWAKRQGKDKQGQ
jgi:hypothetical protein